VYEVIRVYGGRAFLLPEHLDRLARSAGGIRLEVPMETGPLASAVEDLIARGRLDCGMVYLQLTRGRAPRNHVFPRARPTLLFYLRELPPPPPTGGEAVRLLSVADERWRNCWIKSIALLPNVLAKNRAVEAGCDEAVFIEEGRVSECSASNFFAVAKGTLITAPAGEKVLGGITRAAILEEARRLGVKVEERSPGEAEARAADELFIASTTREISHVVGWDGKPAGGGRCGPLTRRLHKSLRRRIESAQARRR